MKIKKIYIILPALMAMIAGRTWGQGTPGYVQQENILVPGITADAGIYTLTLAQKHTARVFTDGLGRAVQTVAVQASPAENDMIQPAAYDRLGRQLVTFLPYSGASTDVIGSYRGNAISSAQPAFYSQSSQYLIPTDTAPHVRNVFENSPMQRLLTAGSVGAGFQPGQHTKTMSYRPNNSTDGNIYMPGITGTFSTSSYYANNMLWVTDATDESGAETRIFKDLNGHVVLKRQMNTGSTTEPYYDTYYVYNAMGMLKYIVPPKATHLIVNGATLASTPVQNLIYTYFYNSMGMLASKIVPNKGLVSIIYDPLNRPVLAQDANMALKKQWYYTKYDAENRPVMEGIYADIIHTTPAAMQTYVTTTIASSYTNNWYEIHTASSTNYYYSDYVFPTTGTTVMAYTYYDNYNWNGDGVTNIATYTAASFPVSNPEGQTITAPVAGTDPVKGIATITMVKTLGPGIATPIWLTKVVLFDHYGRAVQVQSNNQLKYTAPNTLTDVSTTAPDFTGKPWAAIVKKVTGTTPVTNTILTTFNYDATNTRLTDVDQVYNSQANVHIAHYTYNELGKLILRNLGYTGSAYLQNVDYRYNIRGQLLYINNSTLSYDAGKTNSDSNGADVFGMSIMYDQPDASISGVTANYTGRISAVKWMSENNSLTPTNERSYAYSYDALNRYSGSIYAERTGGSGSFNVDTGAFDERNITYDDNGNILTMNRTAATSVGATSHTLIDNLAYSYDGTLPNQLDAVNDATHNTAGFYYTSTSSNYTYDNDGNMTADPYKGLSINYSLFLNKTDSITRAGSGMITYTYDFKGNVLRKNTYNTSGSLTETLDYIDGMVYSSGTISYFPMPEGRVISSGSTLIPQYVISDQQGNARFSFENNGSGGVMPVQENSYYGYGELLGVSTVTTSGSPAFNKNLYNGGSEWQQEFNPLPDYHETFYRNYDPETGRFIAVDPMPESAESMAVYQYAADDPVNGFDPMGDKNHDLPPAPKSQLYQQVPQSLHNGVLEQEQADIAASQAAFEAYWSDGGDDSGDGSYYDSGGGGGGGGGAYYEALADGDPLAIEARDAAGLTPGQTPPGLAESLYGMAEQAQDLGNDVEISYSARSGPLVGYYDNSVSTDGTVNINWVRINANQGGHNGTATVYVETDGLGHAYIEVNNTVFSFGRYAGGDSPALGRFDPVGPGILIKGTHQFATDRMQKFPTNVYQFSNVDANAIYNYLNDIYNCGIPNLGKNGGVYTGLTYTLLGPNCTTIVSGALQVGGANIPIIGSPADFVRFENGDLYPPGMQAH